MNLTDDQKNQILKELDTIVLIDEIPLEQIPDNADMVKSIQDIFPDLDLTADLLKELIKPTINNDSIKKYESNGKSENLINDSQNMVVTVYEPSKTSSQQIINPITDKSSIIPNFDFVESKRFDKLLPIAEQFFDQSHISKIKHGDKPANDWLNAEFAKDVIAFMTNISVRIDTKFVQIPNINDVLVICICSIYDQFRNTLIEGIAKQKYMYRRRRSDPTDPDSRMDEEYGGDDSAMEKCGSEALRRAVELMIPNHWKKQILKIINKKIVEQNRVKKPKAN